MQERKMLPKYRALNLFNEYVLSKFREINAIQTLILAEFLQLQVWL